ncbi:MAG TPA: acetate--CoA ligase [Phycisphaerae bacterium]|nr:acetate--CoA ligase [Phycisphaerae bacterium]HOJ73802.1 acetate--CoA ligase [Phycisphaerae bacterium]HOM50449.1 acetate--CoA ligase [Phycisphaerae bacterium]HOQ85695.1 acetate--CoA ligase [Phycisphaerae bacterium]HPP28150.1 acetate--CoA ligase [Phycisphaerae bacterium]
MSNRDATGPAETRVILPPPEFAAKAYIQSMDQYRQMYKRSIEDPEGFWAELAEGFHWHQRWTKVREYDFAGDISIQWFIGGKTNIAYNCLDRHLATRGDQIAIIWEGNEPGEDATLTYRQLHREVCKFANVLKSRGVKKGDRVSIYMPMVKELAIAMLACARIGAIHSIVFGGFSPEALADRIVDSACEVLITTDGVYRGSKAVTLKANADEAMLTCLRRGVKIKTCIVYERVGRDVLQTTMKEGRDFWWADLMEKASPDCEPEWMDAEDPLFILYTSGSTGKPKGVLHTTGGYMVYTAVTHKYIFDYHDGDVYWCTADIGWVTGHSYVVYGPLCNGAITLMFEGVPTYPDPGRFWDVVDKYKVNIFYTAPTAIRALMSHGDSHVQKRDLSSLRLLGSVGEPINPEAWMWYYRMVGHERCPIVDTWWQTETGGILITPLPGCTPLKPGSATLPFFGVKPVMVTPEGKRIEGPGAGVLCLEEPWPGMMRTVYGQHQRFKETYFSSYAGLYFTGDGCKRDEDGYYWITGRVDDVINVSGHRIGTAEVESALVSHPAVAEAAVVGFPHQIKGQGIYAYVTLVAGQEYTDELKQSLIQHVRKEIGPIATPDVIHWAPGLPKTRSGKIMRRILRKIAEGEPDKVGDVTTLADPSVVENLVSTYQKLT